MNRAALGMLVTACFVLPACGGDDTTAPSEDPAVMEQAAPATGAESNASSAVVPDAGGGNSLNAPRTVGGTHPSGPFPGCTNCPLPAGKPPLGMPGP